MSSRRRPARPRTDRSSPSPGCPRSSRLARARRLGPGQHRPGLPALRHPLGVVEGHRRHQAGRLQGQEGRRLGLRQRVRGHGRRQEGGSRRRHRLHQGHPAVRHDLLLNEADRCRRGDDLQRVRPGPRGEEPRDRRALQARRPQHHQLQRRRHRDAPGRALRARVVAGEGRQRGHRDQVPQGVVQGLDLLPRPPGRLRRVRPRRRLDAWARATRPGR